MELDSHATPRSSSVCVWLSPSAIDHQRLRPSSLLLQWLRRYCDDCSRDPAFPFAQGRGPPGYCHNGRVSTCQNWDPLLMDEVATGIRGHAFTKSYVCGSPTSRDLAPLVPLFLFSVCFPPSLPNNPLRLFLTLHSLSPFSQCCGALWAWLGGWVYSSSSMFIILDWGWCRN